MIEPKRGPFVRSGADGEREKIERRYATAMGRAELASTSVEGRMLEVQKTTLDMAGQSRLDQIRAQMHPELQNQQARAIDAATPDVSVPAPAQAPVQQPNTTG